MILLSVIIEYFSASEINTYYGQLHPIIISYLQSDSASLKRLAVITVNNLTQTGSAVRVLKKYPDLIPLVLKAIDISQEDLIQKIFETMTDFLSEKRVLQPHLPLLIEAATNIALNTDLAFNVREVAIYFLEQIGDTFSKYLVKKHPNVLREVVNSGFKLCCEDDSEFPDEEESPHSLSLYMLHNFAIEVPIQIIYPLFKENILAFCSHQSDPLVRKAGLKILGHCCDSDGLLDSIKDDIDQFTDILVAAMQDQNEKVREAAACVVGQFSEHVVPDFLDRHEKIVPVLFKVLQDHLQISTLSANHADQTEKAIYAVKEFIE
jgi:hypothetical protein